MKTIFTILTIIVCLILAYLAIGVTTIVKNGTTLFANPGSLPRLKTFLSTNSAETNQHSLFPELKPRRYALNNKDLSQIDIIERIKSSAHSLGYKSDEENSGNMDLKFTITTKLLKFVDDLTIQVEIDQKTLIINAKSSSRKGRADFGANIANIRNLFEKLDQAFKN